MITLQSKDLIQYNRLDIVEKISKLKLEVDLIRPLPDETEKRIIQKFKLDWNYNSNAIEGNSLDFGETVSFLMHGITAKGKPLKDHLDLRGHNEAIDYLTHILKNMDQFGERDIRSLHSMLLVEEYSNPFVGDMGVVMERKIHLGEYKKLPNHVITVTGETHYYASPEETPFLMSELVFWLKESIISNELHPLIIASIFHHRFTQIHPFDDGNGRMSRLLMNLILMHFGYPPVVIKEVDKTKYYSSLSQADVGYFDYFIEYIGENLNYSLDLYIKGARGESIEDPSDIKKKLFLLKKEIEGRNDNVKLKRSDQVLADTYINSINPFFNDLSSLLVDFKELFLEETQFVMDFQGGEHSLHNLPIHNHVENILKRFKDSNEFTFCVYRFSNFKVEKNSFGIDLVIGLWIGELDFSIKYGILHGDVLNAIDKNYHSQWLNKSSINKYYHQQFSEIERKKLVADIGEYMFDSVRNLYDRESDTIPNLIIDVHGLWNKIVDSLEYLTIEDKKELKLAVDFKIRNSHVLEITIPSGIFNLIDGYRKTELENTFYSNAFKPDSLKLFYVVEIIHNLPF